jgi:hypothetical protein
VNFTEDESKIDDLLLKEDLTLEDTEFVERCYKKVLKALHPHIEGLSNLEIKKLRQLHSGYFS